eukprot:123330-Prorocentrum_lima.AAC.1
MACRTMTARGNVGSVNHPRHQWCERCSFLDLETLGSRELRNDRRRVAIAAQEHGSQKRARG